MTKSFGDQVEEAATPLPKIWRLMVWDVPSHLSALLGRHGFRQTKKNPAHWWRTFNPKKDKPLAERVRRDLLAAGLKGSWSRVDVPKTPYGKPLFKNARPSNHGLIDFSRPNVSRGTYRLKQRRK